MQELPTTVDSLEIEIYADSKDTEKALDNLVNTLSKVQKNLNGLQGATNKNSKNFQNLSSNVQKLSKNTKGLQSVTNSLGRMGKNNPASGIKDLVDGFKELSGLNFDNKNLQSFVNSIGRLGKANVSGLDFAQLSSGMSSFVNTMSQAKNVDKSTIQITNAVASLAKQGGNIGYVSSGLPNLSNALLDFSNKMSGTKSVSANTIDFTKALGSLASAGKRTAETTGGLSALAKELLNVFNTLSKAPKLREDIVRMAGALGDLARAGSRTSSATRSLSKGLNMFSASAGTATKKSFSLASAIGKLYATYWLLFRAFSKLGDSINIASDLTEVQNVVDVTFGKYKSMVEDMAATSITDFGMSELTVKQISSRFQAMGSAMGFAQGKMADMSIELTKLAADMASFYNLEQEDVAQDLESIFTSETRPLRTYGLDITEASLKTFALNNGLNANLATMTQMEKAMLRYQYVLANTGAAQGDFARTQDTWSNQVRILKQNLEQLATVVGGTLINALKPFVKAMNTAMKSIISFAKTISNALGKIFGWTYEEGSGGFTAEYEDAADSAEDLADGTGKAVDNAKKLKQQLQGIDELNVLTTTQDTSVGSQSGSYEDELSIPTYEAGQWKESGTKFFDSFIDGLYGLGAYIGTVLTNEMNGIDWDNVYQGANNFGSGLASFLNGLISPNLFSALGQTIAGSLNSALYFLNSFGTTFDWKDFGNSIGSGINKFFKTFDFSNLAGTFNVWADGIKTTILTALKKISWSDVLKGGLEFLSEVELDTVAIAFGTFKWMHGGKELVADALHALASQKIATGIGDKSISVSKAVSLSLTVGFASFKLGQWLYDNVDAVRNFSDIIVDWITNGGAEISVTKIIAVTLGGLAIAIPTAVASSALIAALSGLSLTGVKLALTNIALTIATGASVVWSGITVLATSLVGALGTALSTLATTGAAIAPIITGLVAVISAAIVGAKIGETIYEAITGEEVDLSDLIEFDPEVIKGAISLAWEDVKKWWSKNIVAPVISFKATIGTKWSDLKDKWNALKNKATGKTADFKVEVATTISELKEKFRKLINNLIAWVNKKIVNINANLIVTAPKNKLTETLGIDGKKYTIAQIPYLPSFQTGGFPEDGLFFANHNELVGKFSNGKTAVANNEQITQGITQAVYNANREVVTVMQQELSETRKQNELLRQLLVKETVISYKDIGRASQKFASEYSAINGRPAYV